MSKSTFVMLNHRSAWVGAGEDGATPMLRSLHSIDISELTTVEERAAAIIEGLNTQRLAKKGIVLVLGPQHAEYRPFQVPPVGPAELPTIVNNLATTQMTKIGEDSIIDFVAMPQSVAGGANTVFVSATSFQASLLIEELKAKGLTFERILPRVVLPNLLRTSSGSDVQVMIQVFSSEIDFVATQANQLVMVRSSVLPIDGEDRQKLVGRETARSLAVLAAEFGRTEKMDIAVTGDPGDAQAVLETLAAQDLSGHIVPPAEFGSVPNDLQPAKSSYAVLALAALRMDRKPLLDFANPTRPPKDETLKRKLIMAGILAATLIVGLIGIAWLDIRNLDRELASLQSEITVLERSEADDNLNIARVALINDFVSMDARPLALLEQLSEQLPVGEEIRLQQLAVAPKSVARGESAKNLEVKLTARIQGQELKYKPTLMANPGWIFEPNVNPTDLTKSNYYSRSVRETITIPTSFDVNYDRLLAALLGEEDEEEENEESVGPTSAERLVNVQAEQSGEQNDEVADEEAEAEISTDANVDEARDDDDATASDDDTNSEQIEDEDSQDNTDETGQSDESTDDSDDADDP